MKYIRRDRQLLELHYSEQTFFGNHLFFHGTDGRLYCIGNILYGTDILRNDNVRKLLFLNDIYMKIKTLNYISLKNIYWNRYFME